MMKLTLSGRNKIYFLFLAICSIACFSCQQGPDNNRIDVTVEKFILQKDQPNTHIIDVRTDREYQNGHLADADFMDMYQPDFREKILKLDKNQTYYLYCHSGGRSGSAAKFMRQNGFDKVYNIEGGILSMSKAGLKFVK